MILDDPEALHAFDTYGMFSRLAGAADAVQTAWQGRQALPVPQNARYVDKIVVAALSDAAAAAELFAALTADTLNLPVAVCRAYDLPVYADGQAALVILLDHSGDTEETFSAFELADARGTQVLAITSGGALAEYAEQSGVTLWRYALEGVSRLAFYTQVTLLFALVERLGLVRDPDADVREAVDKLRESAQTLGTAAGPTRNPAKRLAAQMIGRLPLIYGGGFMAAVARRWQLSLLQNAKTLALCDELPNLDYNLVQGLANLPEPVRIAPVSLESPQHDHPRLALRQALTRRALMEAGFVPDSVIGLGESALAQALTAALYGDYVSGYLAALYNSDPTPTPVVARLIDQLRSAR
ncbi:MAG: SIS domain-containing protein [Aggregatilineales bacterium]